MNAKEILEVEGGIWPYIIGALIGAAFTQDLDKMKEAYQKGYDAAL
ncbi:class IIb bacteriocin, lactobin A/cerein 7B family [Sphingobacterium sp. xlx-130]